MTHQTRSAQAQTDTQVAQRACACTAKTPEAAKCPTCAAAAKLGIQGRFRINRPDDAWEREADTVADKVVSGPAGAGSVLPITPLIQRQDSEEEETLQASPLARQVDSDEEEEPIQMKSAEGRASATHAASDAASAVQSGGQPLAAAERSYFEPRFGRDLSHVRLHTGATANQAAHGIGANAYTYRNNIAFAAGQFAPGSSAGRHLLAHEITHTLQQRRGSRMLQRQPTSLGAIPLKERKTINIRSIDISVPTKQITEFFKLLSSGRPGTTMSSGATNSFGAGIGANLQTGLGSVGGWLTNKTNALPMNSSIEIALDLSAHGGAHRRYRYTLFEHTTGSGKSKKTTQIMLIEDVGAESAVAQQSSVPSSVSIGGGSYKVKGNWSKGEYSSLHHALSKMSKASHAKATGLTFTRKSGQAGGGEPAHYDEVADAVEVFDNTFQDKSLRTGGVTMSARSILHEIGHALDLRPLEAEWGKFNAAGQSKAAKKTLEKKRSLSGSRYKLDKSNEWQREFGATDRSPAFRTAVRKDSTRDDSSGRLTQEGVAATLKGGATSYSDVSYEEAYAEAFMLYTSDPDRLKALRPETFKFMDKKYK